MKKKSASITFRLCYLDNTSNEACPPRTEEKCLRPLVSCDWSVKCTGVNRLMMMSSLIRLCGCEELPAAAAPESHRGQVPVTSLTASLELNDRAVHTTVAGNSKTMYRQYIKNQEGSHMSRNRTLTEYFPSFFYYYLQLKSPNVQK